MNKKISASLLLCSCAPFCHAATPISEAPDGKVNYPSNFQVEGGANLFVVGEYLYWTAHEDGLYYAQTGTGAGSTSSPPNGSIDFDGHLKQIDTEWDSGVRFGIGGNFPKEGYDFGFYWTWFSTEASDSVKSSNGTILPLWAHPGFASVLEASSAKAKWDLDLNVLDLEWGRSSWFGGHFSLRPFFAVRGLWIDQEMKNYYNYVTTPVITGTLHLKSDFRGAGLRAGANARFALPAGFSVYGIASGSLLYGEFFAGMHILEDQFEAAETKDNFWKGISSFQVALGFSWDTHFSKDRFHIEFHAGWEQNVWFGANQMNHYMNDLNTGFFFKENSNLSLQGLVAGGRFDF